MQKKLIEDIAKEAGVSKQAVSVVLTESPSSLKVDVKMNASSASQGVKVINQLGKSRTPCPCIGLVCSIFVASYPTNVVMTGLLVKPSRASETDRHYGHLAFGRQIR